MAMTLSAASDEILNAKDVVEYFDRNVDPDNVDEIAANAVLLKGLYNDRKLLAKAINEDLKRVTNGTNSRIHSAHSFIVAGAGRTLVRAVVWEKPDLTSIHAPYEMRLLSYGMPHDHNFNLLTIGYWGAGYETEIHEYDRSAIQGYVGEKVRMEFLEKTRLADGKILLFRAGRDVHTQIAPNEFSVSLNIIMQSEREEKQPQFSFDIETRTVTGLIESRVRRLCSALGLARHLADENTVDILEAIGDRHDCPYIRSKALSVLMDVAPDDRERWNHLAERDLNEKARIGWAKAY